MFPHVTPDDPRPLQHRHRQRTEYERIARELRRAERLQRWADRSAALAARLSRLASIRRARVI